MATATPKSTKSAAAAEALAIAVEVPFKDRTFRVLPSIEWPFEALEHYEAGLIASFVKSILADDAEVEAFRAARVKVGDLPEFVAAIQTASGIAGN